MEKYEVIIRNRTDGHCWSLLFYAENFGHAEEQANDGDYLEDIDEIIRIEKDYA